jgi:nucleoside-diphosphate-sugar epimerase
VSGLARRSAPPIAGADLRAAGGFRPDTDWRPLLEGGEIVVHCAGRAHGRIDAATRAAEPEIAAALTRQSRAQGVRRLVLVSSLKAMAEETPPDKPVREPDPPRPEDAYGRMKLAVERAVLAAAGPSLETVILRPPLVYGPGVKANFRTLLRLVASGLPLPFAGIDNRRSLVLLDNLVDLIGAAATHPSAGGRVVLVRDDADFSTAGLIRALAGGLGRRARLFPVPRPIIALGRILPGVGPPLSRLTTSLVVDDRQSREALGWSPPIDAATGLELTARAFLNERG